MEVKLFLKEILVEQTVASLCFLKQCDTIPIGQDGLWLYSVAYLGFDIAASIAWSTLLTLLELLII